MLLIVRGKLMLAINFWIDSFCVEDGLSQKNKELLNEGILVIFNPYIAATMSRTVTST